MELATRSLAFKFGRVLSHCALTLSISPLSSSVTVSKILNTLSTSRSPLFSSNSLTKCLISPCKKGRWLNNLSYRSSLITYLVVFCKRKYNVKFILVLIFRLCVTIALSQFGKKDRLLISSRSDDMGLFEKNWDINVSHHYY